MLGSAAGSLFLSPHFPPPSPLPAGWRGCSLRRADEGGTQEQATPATLFPVGPGHLRRDQPAKRLQEGKPKSSSGGLVCLASTSLQQAVCKQTNHPHYKSFICSLSPPFCQWVCPLRCMGPHKQLIQHPAREGKRWEPRSHPLFTQKDSAGKNSFSPLQELLSKHTSLQSGSSASPAAPSCPLHTAEQKINLSIPSHVGSRWRNPSEEKEEAGRNKWLGMNLFK